MYIATKSHTCVVLFSLLFGIVSALPMPTSQSTPAPNIKVSPDTQLHVVGRSGTSIESEGTVVGHYTPKISQPRALPNDEVSLPKIHKTKKLLEYFLAILRNSCRELKKVG